MVTLISKLDHKEFKKYNTLKVTRHNLNFKWTAFIMHFSSLTDHSKCCIKYSLWLVFLPYYNACRQGAFILKSHQERWHLFSALLSKEFQFGSFTSGVNYCACYFILYVIAHIKVSQSLSEMLLYNYNIWFFSGTKQRC